MKTRFIFYLSIILLFSCSEKPSIEKEFAIHLNFEAVKAYFLLVEKIEKGDTISEKEWIDFLNIEGNRLYLEDANWSKDSINRLKESIETVYFPKKDSNKIEELLQQNYLLFVRRHYKNNRNYSVD